MKFKFNFFICFRRQRKKWEKRRDQKKKRNIPVENQYRPLLDDVDAPNPLVHRVKENVSLQI